MSPKIVSVTGFAGGSGGCFGGGGAARTGANATALQTNATIRLMLNSPSSAAKVVSTFNGLSNLEHKNRS